MNERSDIQADSKQGTVRELCILIERKDLPSLRRLFATDAIYHNVGTPPHVGRKAITAALGSLLENFDGFHWRIVRIAVNGDWVLTERVDELVRGDLRAAIPVMGAFLVTNDTISIWRDYYDPVLAQQLIKGADRSQVVPRHGPDD
jgi:limonene-1,2-epoxide hydrolase